MLTSSGFHHMNFTTQVMPRKYIPGIVYNTAPFSQKEKNILAWPEDELSTDRLKTNQYQFQWHVN